MHINIGDVHIRIPMLSHYSVTFKFTVISDFDSSEARNQLPKQLTLQQLTPTALTATTRSFINCVIFFFFIWTMRL
jgi:hypothetical protein